MPWLRGSGPRVLFGRMYEDPEIELAAFAPGSRVLAIASAGDTAAALAQAGHQVTAIDINPAQLEYARARMTGAPAVAGTLETRQRAVRRVVAAVVPAWRPEQIEPFLRLDDPAAQAVWWRTRLDVARLRLLAAAGLGAVRWIMYVRHRKFRAMARERLGGPSRFSRSGARLLDRFGAGVARHPNATNPYAWRLFLGRECPAYRDPCPLPNPGAVRFLVGDVATHLQEVPPGTYDAVTLSNVLDGPGPGYRDRLLRAAHAAVRPGGVLVLRSMRQPPLHLPPESTNRATQDRSMLWDTVLVQTSI
jgi:SAM-dependent methyltransferase